MMTNKIKFLTGKNVKGSPLLIEKSGDSLSIKILLEKIDENSGYLICLDCNQTMSMETDIGETYVCPNCKTTRKPQWDLEEKFLKYKQLEKLVKEITNIFHGKFADFEDFNLEDIPEIIEVFFEFLNENQKKIARQFILEKNIQLSIASSILISSNQKIIDNLHKSKKEQDEKIEKLIKENEQLKNEFSRYKNKIDEKISQNSISSHIEQAINKQFPESTFKEFLEDNLTEIINQKFGFEDNYSGQNFIEQYRIIKESINMITKLLDYGLDLEAIKLKIAKKQDYDFDYNTISNEMNNYCSGQYNKISDFFERLV